MYFDYIHLYYSPLPSPPHSPLYSYSVLTKIFLRDIFIYVTPAIKDLMKGWSYEQRPCKSLTRKITTLGVMLCT